MSRNTVPGLSVCAILSKVDVAPWASVYFGAGVINLPGKFVDR